jgi:hypothetical protein
MNLTVNYPIAPKKVIPTEVKKQYIIWHGSNARTKRTPYGKMPGKATSIIDIWNNSGEKQGVPYVVDLDGTIYKAFDDSKWSYHLNIPTTNGHYDKQSVGIMFANELNLHKDGGRFYAFSDCPHSTNEYVGKKILKKLWKGYEYWAPIDEAQLDSVLDLTVQLCKKYGINPVFYNGSDWNPRVWEKATIFTHSVVNKDVLDFPPFDPWVIDRIKEKGIAVVDS